MVQSPGQFHIIAPVAFDSPAGGPARFGSGDTELGFKYRFIERTKAVHSRKLASTRSLSCPPATRPAAWEPVTFACSYRSDERLGDKDYLFFGWVLQRKITDKLTLGGEVFHQTASVIGGKDSTGFNLGGIYDLDAHNHLLFSAGRGLQNADDTNQYSWYLGWQITW